jgi:hypothetical protein
MGLSLVLAKAARSRQVHTVHGYPGITTRKGKSRGSKPAVAFLHKSFDIIP